MKLFAKIRPVGDLQAEPQEIETEGPDFATCRQQLDELTPDGWERLHIIVG